MRVRELAGAALIFLLVDCAGSDSGPTPPTVASVTISPDGLTVPVLLSDQLHAVAVDADQAVLSGVQFAWSTTSPAIATISADGLVTGRAVGQTLAIAKAGDVADTVVVRVVDQLTLAVVPADTTIGLTETAPYTVVATDGAGDTVPPPPVIWSSSEHSVATIDTDGVATAVGLGEANIVATAGLIASPPAVLRVAAETGPCFGIATAAGFDGNIAYGFKTVDEPTSSGLFVTADDNGSLHALLTPLTITATVASWSGAVISTSNASVTQRETDGGSSVSTYTSTSGIILPQPVIGLPQISLIVDLDHCTYRIHSAASLATLLTDEFGNQTNAVDMVATVQFAGAVPADWRTAGLLQANGTMGGHSTVWGALHLDQDALMPLGFAAQLFDGSPTEPAVGEASGGFQMVYHP